MAPPTSLPSPSIRWRAQAVVGSAVAVVGLLVAGATPTAAEEYVVRPGDSLSVIARDKGVTTAELAAENGISNLHLIRVGQVLRIPRPEPVIHVVGPGETLGGIAKGAGVRAADLVALNGIANPDLIRVGQKLQIPAGGLVPTPANQAAGYDRLPGRLRANPERLQLIPSFEKWASHYGVPTDLLMAMAYRESGWQASVVSPRGAVGVGQLMPNTSAWVARDLIKIPDLDPMDPDDNIRMSARLLHWLTGHMGGERQAIAAYYQGPGSIRARGLYDDTKDYLTNIAEIRPLFRPR